MSKKKNMLDDLLNNVEKVSKHQIQVLAEFKNLIPPLQQEEFALLEQSILSEGCREALIIWKKSPSESILIDGHNRYEICQKHGIDFSFEIKYFGSLQEVQDWIIDNQLGRRNLSKEQASYLRGKKYNSEKQEGFKGNQYFGKGQNVLHQNTGTTENVESGKGQNVLYQNIGTTENVESGKGQNVLYQNTGTTENVESGKGQNVLYQNTGTTENVESGKGQNVLYQNTGTTGNVESGKGQNVPKQNTAEKIASLYNVNEKTIKRDALFAKAIDKIGEVNPELKRNILSGKTKITKSQVQELAKMENLPVLEKIEDLENLFSLPKTEKPKDELQAKKDFLVKFIKKTTDLMSLEQIEKFCLDLAKKS